MSLKFQVQFLVPNQAYAITYSNGKLLDVRGKRFWEDLKSLKYDLKSCGLKMLPNKRVIVDYEAETPL